MPSSAEAEAAANKSAALEQLRFRRNVANASSSTSRTGYTPSVPMQTSQPLQSRDGTMSSRFFSTAPPTASIAHNYHVIPQMLSNTAYTPYSAAPFPPQTSATSLLPQPNTWAVRPGWAQDKLSSPSGFIPNGNTAQSLRRPYASPTADGREEGPPRKRLNRGPAEDPLNAQGSPSSPQVQLPGQRRRQPSDLSSDDSLPEFSQAFAPQKSRLTRSRPTQIDNDPKNDPRFMTFSISMPTEPPARVLAAWIHTHGNEQEANALLASSWQPKPTSKPAVNEGPKGKVEVPNKSQRAADKEKGRKSMIYANRTTLEAVPTKAAPAISPPPPSHSRPPSGSRVVSQTSPVVIARPPPRRKKMIIDSDSELELTDSDDEPHRPREDSVETKRTLEYLNTAQAEAIQELTGCTPEQANTIIELRPYESVEDLNEKLQQGKKKAGPAGVSPRMFEDCKTIFEGYNSVDSILEDCEQTGATLRATISSWTSSPSDKGKETEGSATPTEQDGALNIHSLGALKESEPKDYLLTQPSLLAPNVELKEYQLMGVNWLNLLYRNQISCILADEMGLGKTIQVISFFAYLKEQGRKGPHLIVVPSSTLENWCREFARFAPTISVQTYYANKDERSMLRQTLLESVRYKSDTDEGWEVLITTYNLAQGDDRDRKFFRRVEWDCSVFDEGHVLKNFQSQRYQSLLKFDSNWRLLLTGTPLQNNLQELVSLMNFILPHKFAESLDKLRAIFKTKGDSKVTLLSQERVSRAKKMMTPFVLRRRKDQVLKDLPKKTVRIEWCDMTTLQNSIYTDALQRSRKTILELDPPVAEPEEVLPTNRNRKPSKKKVPRPKDKLYLENSSNVLMDLRKAASHPMLFRTLFTDEILTGMTKLLIKEPDFKKRGARFDYVKEDMSVMTDSELQLYCATYKSTQKYLQDVECYLDSGKVKVLLELLNRYALEGRKVLIFSQFTQILDILQAILKQREIAYLILTGSTAVDVRQSLVDEFTEDESISVFLLSTKAGGLGITLTAASVVIMFDQDFNPHNDKQAQDRAYRIGQKRDVEVIKLISRSTIEEDMLRLGETKLALDDAVAGDIEDDKDESAPEREMKKSLLSSLRQQFEKQQATTEEGDTSMVVDLEG